MQHRAQSPRRSARPTVIVMFGLAVTLLAPALLSGSSGGRHHPGTADAATAATTTRPTGVNRFLKDSRIRRSSGLVRSTRAPGVLFTHNDRGSKASVYAVGPSGHTLARLTLAGVEAVDWEDMATGPRHRIYVGDIGDDSSTRTTVSVYRFREPTSLTTGRVRARRLSFSYADGAHDAQALLVRPTTGRIYVVTKDDQGAGIYRAPRTLSTGTNVLTRVADAPAGVTGGAFAPDGSFFVLSTRTDALLFRGLHATPTQVSLPERKRGESIEINAAQTRLLAGSEGRRSPVYSVKLPKSADSDGSSDDIEDIEGWTPSLNEEFTTLDASRWNVRTNTSNSNEDSYLLASNTTVSGGFLRIKAQNQSAGGRSYTSGYVDTNGKYAVPNYFRLELRAKVPMEQGMWAAPTWLRPADFSGGEIDLLETYGSEQSNPKIHQTIHSDYGAGHQQSAKPTPFTAVGDSTGTQWHTYVLEKTPGAITMWTDGVKTASWSQGDPSWFDQYYEAGKSWNIRVNLQVGGSWGGRPDGTTNWSGDNTTMLVDYIRTWVPS